MTAGRDGCSRSGAAGRAAEARRDASTARRERARTRCFFATGGRGYPTPYAPPRMPLDPQAVSTLVVVLAVAVVALVLWVAWLQRSDALLRRRLRRLIGEGEGVGLDELLDRQFRRLDTVAERVEALNRLHHELEGLAQHSIQKVGVVRFNPFADTGGDQSFAVALLDAEGNGVVLSSLPGRAETRSFAKAVPAPRTRSRTASPAAMPRSRFTRSARGTISRARSVTRGDAATFPASSGRHSGERSMSAR